MKFQYRSYQRIEMSRRERVLTVALSHPPLNTVDRQMHNELETIFDDVQHDPETDVVVLTGSEKSFSAGGDKTFLTEMADSPETDGDSILSAKRIIMSLLDLNKPVIAKVVGPCLGLGAQLALFSDIIFADEAARIGDPHVKMGVVAGDGGAVIWPQLIGYARAKQYLFTGDIMSGRDAANIGLINAAFPRHELDAAVDAMADKLAGGAQLAIRWTKASVNIGLKQLASSIMDASLAYEYLTFHSEDHREAVAAFTQKRRPKFTGR